MRRIALLMQPNRFHLLFGDELKRYALKHPDWFIRTGPLSPSEIPRLELDAIVGFFDTNESFDAYHSLSTPMIALYRRPTGFRGPCILQDNAEIARQAAEYFGARGIRQFGFVRYPGESDFVAHRHGSPAAGCFWEAERLRAFQAEARKRHIPCSVSPPYCSVSKQPGSPLDAWIEQLPKPAGILCVADGVSEEVLEACYLRNIAVPEQVSVMGIDNDERYCALSNPTLSSVAVSMDRIAERVGHLLEICFQGGRLPRKTYRIGPAGVVERNSTAQVLPEDAVIAEVLTVLRRRAHDSANIKEILSDIPHSRRQVERHFHSVVGRTPYEELIRLRVERAKNLLRQTRRSMSDVASVCGFSGTTHMRRVFMAVTGHAPRAYRSSDT